MKNIFLFSIFLFFAFSGNTQTDKKWLVSMDLGFQQADKRLYHWPEISRRHLIESQASKLVSTYQLSLSFSKKIINYKKINFYGGAGLSVELATFLRPFDHIYPNEIGNELLTHTNKYLKHSIIIPLHAKYKLSKNWSVIIFGLPQFNFHTAARRKGDNYTWWQFHLSSIELSPGVEYNSKKYIFGLKYRAFQIKKIDPILFFSGSTYVMGDEKYETYNPFKLWFSMGYEF